MVVRPFLVASSIALAACSVEGKRPARRHPPPPADASQDPAGENLGRILPDAPFPIEQMLGASPPEVEKHLGDPLGKGMMRKSCVRFVPDRTWFRCAYAEQRYADPSGRFGAVGVEYTDGRATSLWWEEIPGSGPFAPDKALAQVGLRLPGPPKVRHPEERVTVYDYFNHVARLRIHGKEFRAEVSVIGDDWNTSKVQIWENHHLTPDQASRILRRDRPGTPRPRP